MTALALAMLCLMACEPKTPDNPTPDAPGVPAGLALRSATTTSLTFQWSPVSDATSYDWRLLQGTTQAGSGTVKTRNATVEGLTPGTTYKFSVRASGEGGTSDWSSPLEASTESESVNPGPVNPGGEVSSKRYDEFLVPAAEEDGLARAFPGAEGGGMWVTGGRGGAVYHVTNLNDSGQGSLRYGIDNGGRPLTIVFDVAGIIPLTRELKISKGDITIAGQTAPGDGICLKNYTFSITGSNVIIRFIRSRMGDEAKNEDDAMHINSQNNSVKNVIIDHCSLSWSTDECGSFYGVTNFTLQWCVLSESLRNSIHGKGSHGYGGLWGGENATYHHNLLAHHDSRNARIDHDYLSTLKGPVSLLNNVIYNWKGNSTYGGESFNNTDTYRKYNILGNYYRPGPATPSNHIWFIDPTTSCSNCSGLKKYPDGSEVPSGSKIVPGHFYMTGNVMHGKSSMSSDNWTGVSNTKITSTIKSDALFTYGAQTTQVSLQSADKAFDAVLSYAGASLSRDSVDERVSSETRAGTSTYTGSNGSTGGLIDTQGDVGGWPEYKGEPQNDSDADGIPDWFEEEFGMSKTNPADAAGKGLDKYGRYTNLEMYLHWLVRNIVAAQNTDSEYTNL